MAKHLCGDFDLALISLKQAKEMKDLLDDIQDCPSFMRMRPEAEKELTKSILERIKYARHDLNIVEWKLTGKNGFPSLD